MSHPADRYIGLRYDADTFDCADLVALVRRELFGHEVRLPNNRPRGVRGQMEIGELSRAYVVQTDTPQDGDLVLMRHEGRAGHAGVWFGIDGEGWVLHANETNGQAVFHRLRELAHWGARLEGVFAWA